MARARRYDVAIIGMGSAGLTAASVAADLGLRTVVAERARAGGDCLWSGCVPSKTLLASARMAGAVRSAERLGIRTGGIEVDREAVWKRVTEVRELIAAEDDDIEGYVERGVNVVEGAATLIGDKGIAVGDVEFAARRTVIATGSRPALPDIEGIEQVDPLTTDTLWDMPAMPERLTILGAGPSGVEIAHALARLGTDVTLIHRHERILPGEEPSLAELLEHRLEADGVRIMAGKEVRFAEQVEQGTTRLVFASDGDEEEAIESERLLVCCGRRPNFELLGIEVAGIDHADEGILADERSRTSAKRVYAVGDVAGRGHTHTAGYDAAQAIRDIALPGAGRRANGVPWAIFTDPELGHAGLTFEQAVDRFPRKRIERIERDLSGSDRARTDDDPPGRIVLISAGGRLVGAHLLMPGAGEAIGGLQRETSRRTSLMRISSRIEAYPTRMTELQRMAGDGAIEYAARVRRWVPRIPGR